MYTIGKRLLDLSAALFLLIALLPVFVFAAILIKTSSSGPVLFVQRRLGKGGQIFNLYKFRTMTDEIRRDHREVLKGDPDVTWVGNWLRRLKIDELPQLLNVLKGEMSIVGPRPSLPELADMFVGDAHRRLSVRPGLTGLAQVNGNIHLPWEERWKYDVKYVENVSLALDVSIIVKTVAILLLGEGRFVRRID